MLFINLFIIKYLTAQKGIKTTFHSSLFLPDFLYF